MDTIALREIAKVIAEEQFLLHWPLYVLFLALSAVIGFAASFVGGYAKKRGENFATKADFEGLLSQLKLTTAVAEEVKAQVSHADWVSRESKIIRRSKLEELVHAIHEVQAYTDVVRRHRLFNAPTEPSTYPLPKLEVLTGLYFPELTTEVREFTILHRQTMIMIIKCHSAMSAAHDNHEEQLKILTTFKEQYTPHYDSELQTISAIEASARDIMAKLVGVQL